MSVLRIFIDSKISEVKEELHIVKDHLIDSLKYKIWSERYSKKLHFGCGDIHLDGWTNIDFHQSFNSQVDLRLDLRRKLPFQKSSIETIFSEHVFEHFSPDELLDIFTSCSKILKNNGELLFSVPDYVGLSKELFGNRNKKSRFKAFKKDLARFGDHNHLQSEYDYYDNLIRNNFYHKYFYSDILYKKLLKSAGFTKIIKRKPIDGLDSSYRRMFSLYYKASH